MIDSQLSDVSLTLLTYLTSPILFCQFDKRNFAEFAQAKNVRLTSSLRLQKGAAPLLTPPPPSPPCHCALAVIQGLKAACHRFQVASGVFQYIRENVVGGLVGTLTQDLIPDGLSSASVLMLAQVRLKKLYFAYYYFADGPGHMERMFSC